MNAFAEVEAVYEKLGQDEPFYAVLTYDRFKRENLDIDEFFQSGRDQVDTLMQSIAARGHELKRGRALDFGCGVGRLTNALARHFDHVTGVDVSTTMVANAKELAQNDNCEFVVNKEVDLDLFADESFDFVFSDITIQHIPAPASGNYIREFVRLLAPGALAVFLVPDGRYYKQGSVGYRFDKVYREQVRPFYKRLRGKSPVQIHPIAKARVEELVASAGGNVVHIEKHPHVGRTRRFMPLYYWVTK